MCWALSGLSSPVINQQTSSGLQTHLLGVRTTCNAQPFFRFQPLGRYLIIIIDTSGAVVSSRAPSPLHTGQCPRSAQRLVFSAASPSRKQSSKSHERKMFSSFFLINHRTKERCTEGSRRSGGEFFLDRLGCGPAFAGACVSAQRDDIRPDLCLLS